MMKRKSPQPISFPDGLTLLFIGLKLSHQIDWSWWFVLSPALFEWIALSVVAVVIEMRGKP